MEKLNLLNEQTAFRQPVEGIHSAAEILWHCIYWRKVLINAILGDYNYRERTMNEMNFPMVDDLKQKGWEDLKNMFTKAETDLVELLYDRDDSFLNKEYTKGRTFDFLLEGIVQHDIYHLGQLGLIIAILKKKDLITPQREMEI